MPTLLYGKCISISRPQYDEKLEAWIPYASVSWDGDKFHYYRLKDRTETFETEDEALSFGFILARHWIDKERSADNG